MTETKKKHEGFTADERAAMKDRARELKAQQSKEEAAQGVLDAIAGLPDDDRKLAEQIHALVTTAAPHLEPSTWYGMPAYKSDGKVICFFQPASKFKVRYSTFGFETTAKLDDGDVWPVGFAVNKLSDADKKMLSNLVVKAAS